ALHSPTRTRSPGSSTTRRATSGVSGHAASSGRAEAISATTNGPPWARLSACRGPRVRSDCISVVLLAEPGLDPRGRARELRVGAAHLGTARDDGPRGLPATTRARDPADRARRGPAA